MSKQKILVADKLSQDGLDVLAKYPELDVDVKTGMSPGELVKAIGAYHALIIRSSSTVTKEVIEAADNLKVIGRAGVGVDNVDTEAATQRGIIVMNVPAGNTVSTAEHTVAMIFALARQIPQACASLASGKWERSKFVGTELFGKTLGVVGLGKIGLEVSRRLQAAGMRVIAYDPFLSKERAEKLEIELVELNKLYADADFITVHTPLTPETKGMIGAEQIALMKPSVRLINCARGGIIDEQALRKAIDEGKVAGAAIDVYPQEPPEKGHPLIGVPQIICTPHLGASTQEAQRNVAVEMAQQVADALLEGGVRNAVNMPSVDAKTLKILRPYLTLGERLASLAAQFFGGKISEVSITYVGEMTHYDTSPVTLAVLKGLLSPFVENVNYVNASLLAESRDIKVVESKATKNEEFSNLLTLELKQNGASMVVQGTLSSRREPRVVRIEDYAIESAPEGSMLIIKNEDKPGLIGALGTLLGKSSINIASMSNGREAPGGEALSVLNIDQPLEEAVMAEVRKLPLVMDAKFIQL